MRLFKERSFPEQTLSRAARRRRQQGHVQGGLTPLPGRQTATLDVASSCSCGVLDPNQHGGHPRPSGRPPLPLASPLRTVRPPSACGSGGGRAGTVGAARHRSRKCRPGSAGPEPRLPFPGARGRRHFLLLLLSCWPAAGPKLVKSNRNRHEANELYLTLTATSGIV